MTATGRRQIQPEMIEKVSRCDQVLKVRLVRHLHVLIYSATDRRIIPTFGVNKTKQGILLQLYRILPPIPPLGWAHFENS